MNQNQFHNELKTILKGYKVMNSSLEKKIKKLGFDIERNKNHIILSYFINNKTFEFPLSKTASDYRAGYEQASIIWRTLKVEFAS